MSGCWWYGSRGWIFQPVFHYILLPCNRWLQRSNVTKQTSHTEVHTKKRYVTEFLHAEKIAPTDIHWCLLNVDGDQPTDVSTVRGGWCISAVGQWYDRHAILQRAVQSCHTTKWRASWSAHLCKLANGGDYVALLNSVIVLFVSGVVSMKIPRRHYFWRNLHKIVGFK